MPHPNEDPALTSARREAIVTGVITLCMMLYTVSYCYLYGYGRKVADLKFVYGFPDWIFWGILVPWGVCVVISFLYGSVFMRDEYLGEDLEGSEEEDFYVKEGEHAG